MLGYSRILLPWDSQPPFETGASELARNLGFTHVWLVGATPLINNIITPGAGALTSAVGSAQRSSGPGGIGATQSGAGAYLQALGNPFATSTCSYVWAESFSVDTGTSASGSVITDSNAALTSIANSGALEIRKIGSDINIIRAQQAIVLTASAVRTDNRFNVGAVSVAGNNGRHAIFSNGRLAASSTPASSYTHGTSGVGSSGVIADNVQQAGQLYVLAFAPVVVPDTALAELTAGLNVWRLFEPTSIWVPVSAGGGAPTVALTNNLATTSQGAVTPSISLALTGNGATASAGATVAALSLAVAGNAATSAVGTAVAALSLGLTGQVATSSVGSVGIGGATQALTGNAATASAGTPVAAISLALTGNGVTSSVGTATPALSKAITGNAATTSAGTPTAALSLAITGNAATASAGTVAVPGVIVPSSNLATTAAGTVAPGITLALTGNGATASVGPVSPAISLALSGLAGTSSAGIVIPGLSLALTGNSAAAAAGTVAVATGDATVALTGNLATAYAGSLGIGGAAGASAWWRYDVPVNDMRYAVPVHNLRYDVDTENLT